MKEVLNKFDEINRRLTEGAIEECGMGLLNGKLGLCIYFFHLARQTGKAEYQEMAENLISEVYENLGKNKTSTDFEMGLAGIGWGISHLVSSGYVDADLDEALEELDDEIYVFLVDNIGSVPSNSRNGIIGYIFYCLVRIEHSSKTGNETNIYIFKKLASELFNQLGQLIEEEKIQDREPILFSIYWDLPLILILISKAKSLNINRFKLERILDYLTPILVSLYPNLHSNRLYLLLGMEYALKEFENSSLRRHSALLKQSIDVVEVVNTELKNLNISVSDGVCGLYFISKELSKITQDETFLIPAELIGRKINNAICWRDLEFYSPFLKSIGIISGLAGLGLTLLEFIETEKD
ncbi:lanthionine synthetase LanC family protein [Algoriphagus resistens]|uniref:lanthionine synthetase LanC family protein n=1 Tax=Algoriphagus resistens TaxID=1750590 RepID=UPI000716ACCD|nr:lanthionine synthetase LanC family protein [Algoriphagus resistens]